MRPPVPAPPVARVKLLGEDFALKGEDPTRLERLAQDLNDRLKRIAQDLNLNAQPSKTALLVALNLLDELESLKSEHAAFQDLTRKAISAMHRKIEHTLAEEPTPA